MTEARDLTRALGGTWYGHFGTAPCPVCQPEARADQNALTISDGNRTLLAHCKRLARVAFNRFCILLPGNS